MSALLVFVGLGNAQAQVVRVDPAAVGAETETAPSAESASSISDLNGANKSVDQIIRQAKSQASRNQQEARRTALSSAAEISGVSVSQQKPGGGDPGKLTVDEARAVLFKDGKVLFVKGRRSKSELCLGKIFSHFKGHLAVEVSAWRDDHEVKGGANHKNILGIISKAHRDGLGTVYEIRRTEAGVYEVDIKDSLRMKTVSARIELDAEGELKSLRVARLVLGLVQGESLSCARAEAVPF